VSLYDSLLFLHVLAATLLLGLAAGFWAIILATRPGAAIISGRAAGMVAQPMGMSIGLASGLTLVFGIALAIDVDGYELWDGWIVASIVLWAVGAFAGFRGGEALGRAGAGGEGAPAARRLGILLHSTASVAVLIVLYLMVTKPGA
jgi:uncharacterized membrane protein